MRRVRFWILGTTLGCFAAGMTLGLAIGSSTIEPRAATSADAGYVERFTRDFRLSEAQADLLRMVLQRRRDEELEVFRTTDHAQLPATVQAQLHAARDREEQRIRRLLDDTQRAEYDRLSSGTNSR